MVQSFSQIIQKLPELRKKVSHGTHKSIGVLSNVIVNSFSEILEYSCLNEGINVNVEVGNYDNISVDSKSFGSKDMVVVIWEFANLTEGLTYKYPLWDDEKKEDFFDQMTHQIDATLESLSAVPTVFLTKFSCLPFTNIQDKTFRDLANLESSLNDYLQKALSDNMHLVNTDQLFAEYSIGESIDKRFWFSSKAPYKSSFFIGLADYIVANICPLYGKSKKLLVVDCDNTLWKGVVGEEGVNGIKLSSEHMDGRVFELIHHKLLNLKNQGVLLAMVSKNNEEDVLEVFRERKDFVLSVDDFVDYRINWKNKAENIRDIVNDLNIGIDSVVFVDDSDFEIELVRTQIPEVKCFKVPQKGYNYPDHFAKVQREFNSLRTTEIDAQKTQIYQVSKKRDSLKKSSSSLEDYLTSLEMEMTVYRDAHDFVPRMAQMTQKTNQFNLTTRRYTEAEIQHLCTSADHHVYAFDLKDKFGEMGMTGLCLVNIGSQEAYLDTFLMSCRVLGRGAEETFVKVVLADLKDSKVQKLKSEYIRTFKNDQVSDFYDKLGFSVLEKNDQGTKYNLVLNDFTDFTIEGISTDKKW